MSDKERWIHSDIHLRARTHSEQEQKKLNLCVLHQYVLYAVLTVQLDLLKIAAFHQLYENAMREKYVAQLDANAHTSTVGSNVNFTSRTSHAGAFY